MPTYTPLQSIELTAATASVTFSGIPQTYQDLVVVVNAGITSGTEDVALTFNGDTGNNYSRTYMYGNGTSVVSGRNSSVARIALGSFGSGSINGTNIFNVMNYSNTTTYKSVISRGNNTTNHAIEYVGLWRNTSAITSMGLATTGSTWMAGSTFDLYGISPVAANNAQAAGGTDIFYDASYVYHVFKGSGTFTPYRNLTVDALIIAGGGGGAGAGAGAGGLRQISNISTTSNTNYTITVGAGGVGTSPFSAVGGNGGNSSAFTYSATGGGGGAGFGGSPKWNGASGGSGGGATPDSGSTGTAGSGNAGGYTPVEGYAGGGTSAANPYPVGGGGGAGAVGGTGSGNQPGNGGAGLSTYSSWGAATGTGQNVSGTYWFAGGGGGRGYSSPYTLVGAGGNGGGGTGAYSGQTYEYSLICGVTNTGGGGGGTNETGGSGGSGLVIVRYAR